MKTLAATLLALALASSAAAYATRSLPFRNPDREAVYVQHLLRVHSDPRAYCSAPTDRLIQCETRIKGKLYRLDMVKLSPRLARVCLHVPLDLVAPQCFTQRHHDARANPWF